MRKLKGKEYNQQIELRRINNEIKEKMKMEEEEKRKEEEEKEIERNK